MSDFLKKYLKICGIGLGILAVVAVTVFVVRYCSRPAETAVMNEMSVTDTEAEPTEKVPSVVMRESRRLKETANTPVPTPTFTPEPTHDIVFSENSHISPTPVTEPTPDVEAKIPDMATETPEQRTGKYKYECAISVTCKDIIPVDEKNAKAEIVPQNGIILEKTSAGFNEGETVSEVLIRVLKEKKIHFDYEAKSSVGGGYIKAIGNLYQFDFGGKSGWVYTVNGENINVGASEYKLSDGDLVEWKYVK